MQFPLTKFLRTLLFPSDLSGQVGLVLARQCPFQNASAQRGVVCGTDQSGP